jgi:hypothetical protein
MTKQGEKYPSIALNTFNDFQCLLKALKRSNPIATEEDIIEFIGHLLDATVYHICNCMLWDTEEDFFDVMEMLLLGGTFAELVKLMEG